MTDLALQARPFDRTADMAMVERWWDGHGQTGVPAPALPRIGMVATGIVDGDRRDLVAGWLYQTDSAMAWLEWVVSDPDIPSSRRPGAVVFLIDRLCVEAARRGFGVVVMATPNRQLADRAKICGFDIDETSTMLLTWSPAPTGPGQPREADHV